MVSDHVWVFNMDDSEKYNNLTRRLLQQGYDINNYPTYVRLPFTHINEKHDIEHFKMYHGFEFNRWYVEGLVYKTGCGKYIKGMADEMYDQIYFGDADYCYENDNPVINCPFYHSDCECNDPNFSCDDTHALNFCVCHFTEEPYEYENSIEKVRKDLNKLRKEKYEEFVAKKKGHVCLNQAQYNLEKKEWSQHYSPSICARECRQNYCPIRGRELNSVKGNVYYDIKESGIYHQGTIFDGMEWVTITKGKRYFNKKVSLDICEDFVKFEKDVIQKRYHWNHESTMQLIDKTFKGEIINIKACAKESRDLLQDLADLKNGINIVHDSDLIKREKEKKHIKRQEAIARRIKKLEKVLLTKGYDAIEPFSQEKRNIDKLITPERIKELEELRVQNEKNNKPMVTYSIFDAV